MWGFLGEICPGEVSRTWLRQKQIDRQLLTGYTITSAMSGVGIVWWQSFSGKNLGSGDFLGAVCPGELVKTETAGQTAFNWLY